MFAMFATDKLDVPWTFSVPVRNAFAVVSAFEAYWFPETVRFAPAVDVPIPTGGI